MKVKSMEQDNSEAVKIFWTGGWDSTFRILQVILLEKRKVQPYYIIDPTRKSTDAEIKAIDTIKDRLFLNYPGTKELLLPIIVGNVSNIRANHEITEAYQRILKQKELGIQYEFLTRYCLQEGIDNVEIAAEKGPDDGIYKLIKDLVVKINEDTYPNYEIDSNYSGTDVYTLCKYFWYPILTITKLDMQEIAIKERFEDLMELTWFCHNPRKYGEHYEPCGVCVPCINVMSAGMERRIPLRSKIRYCLRVRYRVKELSRRYPNLFSFLRQWKTKLLK